MYRVFYRALGRDWYPLELFDLETACQYALAYVRTRGVVEAGVVDQDGGITYVENI